MRLIINISVILSLLLASLKGYSQNLHTSSDKAMKKYTEGLTAFDFLDFNKAETSFKEALAADKRFYEAYIMLGELLAKQSRFSEAKSNYRQAVKIDSLFFKPVFFNLAQAEMMSGDYKNALIHFNVYLSQEGMSSKNRVVAAKNAKNCEFALVAMKNPVPFNPVNLGTGINTDDDEYWPSLTADGQMLLFTRQPNNSNNSSFRGIVQEDFYVSFYDGSSWQKSVNAGSPLNSVQNEGAQTLSSDGSYMFFTGCNRPGGMGACDIYFSAFSNGKWSVPANVGPPINTSRWESQPSISSDGNTLFFSSSRHGGKGGKDIWYARLNNNNQWSEPINMPNVNTDGDEMSPFIHFDGKSLYFASDGHSGMGGFDLYMTRLLNDTTWSEPKNLGYPINTYNDELGLIIEAGGQKAYFSSTRDKAKGKDIFSFDLYESARPDPVSYMKGRVYDKETGSLLKADYQLTNLTTGKLIVKNATDESGNFLVCLPSGYNYGINVSKPGYLFFSENFTFEGIHTVLEPFIKKIILNPTKVGEKMLLANVFYEIDSWELKHESMTELNHLAELLSANKNLVMEIGGYTDSTGSNAYNLSLSEKRALSVVNYLVKKGISSARLTYKGYGNTSNLGDNVTIEGRKLNRRTEAKVVEMKK